MPHYDTIIIGAGHNGLICANYLARSGQRVLVLEAADKLGGLASTQEFHPGFKTSVAHTINQFSEKIIKDLDLAAFGFTTNQKNLASIGLSADGKHITLDNQQLSGVSIEDAKAYQGYFSSLKKLADMLKPFWLKTVPRIGNNSLSEIITYGFLGLKMRLLGKKVMREFLRVVSLPMRDLMDENFDNKTLKAMLSWDGLIGSKLAPRSPNSSVLALLYRMSGQSSGMHYVPTGGVAGFINVLRASAEASGVEIRRNATVKQIIVDEDVDDDVVENVAENVAESESELCASAVLLANGEKINATRIVSSADPKTTFFKLVGVENLEIEFCNRIRRLRSDGFVAKLHLALKGLPEFSGLTSPDGRMIIASDMDAIEFAFDDSKYGEFSESPVMEIVIPSLHNEDIAPAGQHVLSAHLMYVPYKLKGGWNQQAKDQLCERAIKVIEQYAPDIRSHILHAEILTPADLEESYGVSGGHWHHTEFALDQLFMMRPTYEAAQYSTPIKSLYLCGAGCHPGGGLMGGPGHNAALEILK